MGFVAFEVILLVVVIGVIIAYDVVYGSAFRKLFPKLFNKRGKIDPDYSKKLRFFNFERISDHKVLLNCVKLAVDFEGYQHLLSQVHETLPNHKVKSIKDLIASAGISVGCDNLFVIDNLNKLGNTVAAIDWDGHNLFYVIGGCRGKDELFVRFILYIDNAQQLNIYIPQIGNSYDILNNRAFKTSDLVNEAKKSLDISVERLLKVSRSNHYGVSAVIDHQVKVLRGDSTFQFDKSHTLVELPSSIRNSLLVDYIGIDIDVRRAFHLPRDISVVNFNPVVELDYSTQNCKLVLNQWAMAMDQELLNKCSVYDIASMKSDDWSRKDNPEESMFEYGDRWLKKQIFEIRKTDFIAAAEFVTNIDADELINLNVWIKNVTPLGDDKYEYAHIMGTDDKYASNFTPFKSVE